MSGEAEVVIAHHLSLYDDVLSPEFAAFLNLIALLA